MAQPLDQPFRLIKSQRGDKLVERGYIHSQHRRVGEVKHWLCEQRGICNARIDTKGTEIVKRTNEHLHAPAELYETKIGSKRKVRESQDTSR